MYKMSLDKKNNFPSYLKNPRSSLPYVIPPPPKLPSGASTPINVKPEPAPNAPPPIQLPSQQTSTLFDSVKQGFGFGSGSSIARSIFGGPSQEKNQPTSTGTAKAPFIDEFLKCMERTENNMEECKQLLMNDNKV
jgi:hypothetical protein